MSEHILAKKAVSYWSEKQPAAQTTEINNTFNHYV